MINSNILTDEFKVDFANIVANLSLRAENKIVNSSHDDIVAELKKAGMNDTDADKNVAPTIENAQNRIDTLRKFVPYYMQWLFDNNHISLDEFEAMFMQMRNDAASYRYSDLQSAFLIQHGINSAKEFLDKLEHPAG